MGAALPVNFSKRLDILFVAHRFPPFMGGIETHCFEVGRRMVADGHRVTVLTTDPSCALPAEEETAGMRVLRVAAHPRRSDVLFAPGIFDRVRRSTCDILHVQGFHTFVPPLAMAAAATGARKFVMTFHSGGHSSRLRNLVRGAQKFAFGPLIRRAAQLIAVSEFEADHFAQALRIARERIVVVPNGAEIPHQSGDVVRDPDRPLILSVGRLERYKGHHRAIAALPDVLRRKPGAQLRIVGAGPYEVALRAEMRRLGVEAHVTIAGVPAGARAEMGALLAEASVVVLLSDYEAHPVAALEAIAVGRPVLASDCSGFREMAAKGLVRAIDLNGTAEAVADEIVRLIDRPDRPQLAAPAAAFGDWNDCANALLSIYSRVLRGGSQPQLNAFAGAS
jgi:glycosyltransferase involved in cell wall biosynthesis